MKTPLAKSLFYLMILLGLPVFLGLKSEQKSATMDRLMEKLIKPAYARLKDDTDAFVGTSQTLCKAPSPANLTLAQHSFDQVVRSWGKIEMVRFGTILADNLIERMHFFPDRRSRGLKQVQKVLVTSDPSVLELDSLRNKSVAVQGFNAAEFLLFGRGHENLGQRDGENNFRCRYLTSVAVNINYMANKLHQGWNSDAIFLDMWLKPGPKNPVFGDDKQALAHLLSTIVHGIEEVRDVRLKAFLGTEPKRDRPKSAPLWRSKNSLPLLHSDLKSLYKFYQVSEVGALLSDPNVDRKVIELFEKAIKLSEGKEPSAELLKNPSKRAKLEELHDVMAQLTLAFYNDFAGPLGVVIGFFFADGD